MYAFTAAHAMTNNSDRDLSRFALARSETLLLREDPMDTSASNASAGDIWNQCACCGYCDAAMAPWQRRCVPLWVGTLLSTDKKIGRTDALTSIGVAKKTPLDSPGHIDRASSVSSRLSLHAPRALEAGHRCVCVCAQALMQSVQRLSQCRQAQADLNFRCFLGYAEAAPLSIG